MPITIQYQPSAQTLGDVAFLGGLGRFRQAQDQFNLGADQFNQQLAERQRQFNIGTALDAARLRQQAQLAQFQAAVQAAQQQRSIFANQQQAAFQAIVGQQRDAQNFAQQVALVGQQQAFQNQFQQNAHLQDVQLQNDRAQFAQRQAEFQALQRARGQIRDPAQWAQVIDQFNQRWANTGLPPVGADIFGPATPDPMQAMQEWANTVNQQTFGGQPVVTVTPDGKPFLVPYQNTPAGIEQDHQATLEANREKAEQQLQLELAKQAQSQQERVVEMENARREYAQQFADAQIKAAAARPTIGNSPPELPDYGGLIQQGYSQWDRNWGGALRELRGQNQPAQAQPVVQPRAAQPPVQQKAPPVDQQAVYRQVSLPVIPQELLSMERVFPLASAFGQGDLPVLNQMLAQTRTLGRTPDPRLLAQAYNDISRGNLEDARMTIAAGLLPLVATDAEVMRLPQGTIYYDTRTNKVIRHD